MVYRRAYLASVGGILTAGTAGCGVILGNEPARFGASPSAVSDAARQETGYELAGRETMEVEREFSVADQTRRVVVTNRLAKYEKSVDLGPLGKLRGAVFTSLTTPQVNVLGEEFNPVGSMSAAELAMMVQDRYEEITNLQKQGESDVTINGQTTTQASFSADAMLEGNPLKLILHVSEAVKLGEDFVVTFGAYPDRIPGEEANVLQLMGAVESA